MDFSGISTVIGENNVLIGFLLVVGILLWKFLIQPIINQDEPVPETLETDHQG